MDNLNNKKNYIFISPHLDDAILSAGGLIYDLKDKGKVKIITIFTKGDNFFLKRKKEDENVCHYLGLDYLHLDFIDVLWRNSSNLIEEKNLEKTIINRLKKSIKNNKDTMIFAPLSTGNHIDHILINKICRDNYTNVIYWEDYPYNLKSNLSEELVKKNGFSCFEYKKNLYIKEKLIKFYKSQIPSLFGDKPIILKKERYYFKT